MRNGISRNVFIWISLIMSELGHFFFHLRVIVRSFFVNCLFMSFSLFFFFFSVGFHSFPPQILRGLCKIISPLSVLYIVNISLSLSVDFA